MKNFLTIFLICLACSAFGQAGKEFPKAKPKVYGWILTGGQQTWGNVTIILNNGDTTTGYATVQQYVYKLEPGEPQAKGQLRSHDYQPIKIMNGNHETLERKVFRECYVTIPGTTKVIHL